jgi:putative oxidoreductase
MIIEKWFSPIFDLVIRLWMANIFWKSGQTKIANMDSTIMLFKYEYNVPFFSPEVAAYMATSAELVLPILLVLGFATRASAFILFIMVTVIQYGLGADYQLTEHYYWMFLLLMLVMHGAGRFSIDRLIRKKCFGGYWHGHAKKD